VKRHLCLLGDANSVHLRRWAQEMLARGWRVSVVTARPQPIDGVEQRVLPAVQRASDWLWLVGAARRHVEDLAPDIVHAHYVTSYGTLAARCGRHPLVMTAWGSDLLVTPRRNALLHWLTGWTLRRADLVTGDSLDLVAAIDAYRPRQPAVRIHWGADTTRFQPAPWADKPGFGIASLRAWDDNYRIHTIVAALGRLMAADPTCRCTCTCWAAGRARRRCARRCARSGCRTTSPSTVASATPRCRPCWRSARCRCRCR